MLKTVTLFNIFVEIVIYLFSGILDEQKVQKSIYFK